MKRITFIMALLLLSVSFLTSSVFPYTINKEVKRAGTGFIAKSPDTLGTITVKIKYTKNRLIYEISKTRTIDLKMRDSGVFEVSKLPESLKVSYLWADKPFDPVSTVDVELPPNTMLSELIKENDNNFTNVAPLFFSPEVLNSNHDYRASMERIEQARIEKERIDQEKAREAEALAASEAKALADSKVEAPVVTPEDAVAKEKKKDQKKYLTYKLGETYFQKEIAKYKKTHTPAETIGYELGLRVTSEEIMYTFTLLDDNKIIVSVAGSSAKGKYKIEKNSLYIQKHDTKEWVKTGIFQKNQSILVLMGTYGNYELDRSMEPLPENNQ